VLNADKRRDGSFVAKQGHSIHPDSRSGEVGSVPVALWSDMVVSLTMRGAMM
jgi:hypothetical protein